MKKSIENKLEKFAKITGLTERVTISNGTLYVLLLQPERCDFFHNIIRTFYRENINPDGGVNMSFIGDEFAFDFVSIEDESPTFEEKLTDDITEGAMKEESDVDIALNLEAEEKRGK